MCLLNAQLKNVPRACLIDYLISRWSQSNLTQGVTRLHKPQGVNEAMAGRRQYRSDERAAIASAMAAAGGAGSQHNKTDVAFAELGDSDLTHF